MVLRQEDPILGVQMLPGPVPLRAFLAAATTKGASRTLAEATDLAIQEWEDHVRREFGDRKSMQAALSDLMPSVRVRQESTARQAVYRGMADIKGFTTETAVVAFMIHPSATRADWCDTALLGGSQGVRRLRSAVSIQYTSTLQSSPWGRRALSPNDQPGEGAILREYCRPTDLPIEIEVEGRCVHYTLATEGIGTRTEADFFLAEYYPGNHPLYAEDSDTPTRWVYATIEEPAKRLIFDVLVHREVWSEAAPQIRTFDTAVHGVADPNSPSRRRDLLDLRITPTTLPNGPGRFWCQGLPRYPDMLHDVASRSGWNLDDFRGYRCEITYPLYGSQVCMLFSPPSRGLRDTSGRHDRGNDPNDKPTSPRVRR